MLALRDRTIHRALAERAAERDRLSAYGTIAAGIAHEVKNPLGGIRGAAEILASRTSDAKSRETAELIVREVDRIRALVDDLLVFHQRDALSSGRNNIHQLLDQVLELLSMDPLAAGVKLERSFDPSIPELHADPSRLTQVFLNLGRNALQALDGEGTLLVETRMALDQRLPSARGASVPTVAVTVADDGPGIEPDVFEQLSTPFFTTRAGGTGLGLAREPPLGGAPWRRAAARERAGPRHARARLPADRRARARGAGMSALPPSVLVADDEPSIRFVLRETLAELGCEVAEADDGEAALEALASGKHALAFLDIRMPGPAASSCSTACRASASTRRS